jgi:hypothetical protein
MDKYEIGLRVDAVPSHNVANFAKDVTKKYIEAARFEIDDETGFAHFEDDDDTEIAVFTDFLYIIRSDALLS